MSNYTYFNKEGQWRGTILLGSFSTEADAVAILQDGDILAHGLYSEQSYFDKARSVVVDLPTKPSPFHIFDYALVRWFDPRTEQDHIAANRTKRDALLAACDWTQLPDVPTATQHLWALYRKDLRDITKQADQTTIIWPTAPI